MSKLPLRDPVTGRFLFSKVKPQEPVVALAYTVIYVVCFCTFALTIALAFFFIQKERLANKVIENNRLIEEILEKEAAIIVVPELPESEFETPYAPPPEELEGAPEPDPVSDEEKPRSKIRVFRGTEVTEYEP